MELFSTLCGSLDGRGVCERMDIWLSPSTVDLKLSQYCLLISYVLCLVAQSCPALCDPMECSPPGSSVHGDSPGKITGVGCHALFQGIFLTQGSNPGLPHCRRMLHCLNPIQSKKFKKKKDCSVELSLEDTCPDRDYISQPPNPMKWGYF